MMNWNLQRPGSEGHRSSLWRPHQGCVFVMGADPHLLSMMSDYLETHGFSVESATSAADAARLISGGSMDIVLLDLRLSREEGLDILRMLRAMSNVPAIIITSHESYEMDRGAGLKLGASDYLLTPLRLCELLTRVQGTLRWNGAAVSGATSPRRRHDTPVYRFGSWTLACKDRRLTTEDGSEVALTNGEFGLLVAFLGAPHRILSREQLLQATRLHEDILDRSIDVKILRLRRKLEVKPHAPAIICTVRGIGYSFNLKVERVRN